ncbi:MAG: helix-turn-helix transcriptional regulator [Candidatus Omnitrophota bacterium]
MRKISNLGAIIKTQRKKLKLTAEALAKKAGIDRTYISKIENYNLTPSWEILTAIGRELKISGLEDLYLQQKHPEIIRDKNAKSYKEISHLNKRIPTIHDELIDFTSKTSPKHYSTIKAFVINLLNKYKPSEIHNTRLIEELIKRIKKIIKDYENYQKIYQEEEAAIIKLITPF